MSLQIRPLSKNSDKLFESFLKFIGENKLLKKGEKYLLTVSGGMDSMVMTDLFSKTDFDFGIAHCNFTLRGKESDEDERFVLKLSSDLKKPFHTKRFDTLNYTKENKCSVQEAAREQRYSWFHELSLKHGYTKILTAHHQDDSIETFFINLIRGTGPAGLRGISMINGKVIRPLLFARKTEIISYAQKHNLTYRDDSSNASDKYLRNRIRHHVIPSLMENTEGFEENMNGLMKEMSFLHEYVSKKMDEWKSTNVVTDEYGNLKIPIAAILKESNPIFFLSGLLYRFGIRGIDCTKLLKSRMPGKIFQSKNHSVLRDREFLIIRSKEEKNEVTFLIETLPIRFTAGKKNISITEESAEIKTDTTRNLNVQHFSGDNLKFPLWIRPWQAGDHFIPLGMKGRKKVSDFFTDLKLNRFEKDNALILLSGKNIVCILGHRIDNRFKITSDTQKILTIVITGK